LISATSVWVLPCSSRRWPRRSVESFDTFGIVESDLIDPRMTRNRLMRPANGSAIVFQTKTAVGPDSLTWIVVSAPALSAALITRSAAAGR